MRRPHLSHPALWAWVVVAVVLGTLVIAGCKRGGSGSGATADDRLRWDQGRWDAARWG